MMSLILKLILPVAQAVAVRGYHVMPITVEDFAGHYEIVSCGRAGSNARAEVIVQGSQLRIVAADGSLIAAFDEVSPSGPESVGTISVDRQKGRVTTSSLSLRDGNLSVESKTVSAFSRGVSADRESCSFKQAVEIR